MRTRSLSWRNATAVNTRQPATALSSGPVTRDTPSPSASDSAAVTTTGVTDLTTFGAPAQRVIAFQANTVLTRPPVKSAAAAPGLPHKNTRITASTAVVTA